VKFKVNAIRNKDSIPEYDFLKLNKEGVTLIQGLYAKPTGLVKDLKAIINII
jgi:hypothetical protein